MAAVVASSAMVKCSDDRVCVCSSLRGSLSSMYPGAVIPRRWSNTWVLIRDRLQLLYSFTPEAAVDISRLVASAASRITRDVSVYEVFE